jgi:hypothetical protein
MDFMETMLLVGLFKALLFDETTFATATPTPAVLHALLARWVKSGEKIPASFGSFHGPGRRSVLAAAAAAAAPLHDPLEQLMKCCKQLVTRAASTHTTQRHGTAAEWTACISMLTAVFRTPGTFGGFAAEVLMTTYADYPPFVPALPAHTSDMDPDPDLDAADLDFDGGGFMDAMYDGGGITTAATTAYECAEPLPVPVPEPAAEPSAPANLPASVPLSTQLSEENLDELALAFGKACSAMIARSTSDSSVNTGETKTPRSGTPAVKCDRSALQVETTMVASVLMDSTVEPPKLPRRSNGTVMLQPAMYVHTWMNGAAK